MSLRPRSVVTVILAIMAVGASCLAAAAADPPPPASGPQPAETAAPQPDPGVLSDIKLYFTAPLRWDGAEWAWFGGALLAIGASHSLDNRVREHFVKNLSPGEACNSEDVHDAIPTAGVFLATLAYASVLDDNGGGRGGGGQLWGGGCGGGRPHV